MNIHTYVDQPSSLRQHTENLRLNERNIPSSPLQPYLDFRPVMTKYSIFPVVDPRAPIGVPLTQQPTYNIESTFNPGNSSAPWSGYASNINKESELKNQIYALQACPQATYIPSSKSSLYQVKWTNSTNQQQPFPELFHDQTFNPVNANPPSDKIGYALFNNATRMQLKEL